MCYTNCAVYVCVFAAGLQWKWACRSAQLGPVTQRCGTWWWSPAEEQLRTRCQSFAAERLSSLQRGQPVARALHLYVFDQTPSRACDETSFLRTHTAAFILIPYSGELSVVITISIIPAATWRKSDQQCVAVLQSLHKTNWKWMFSVEKWKKKKKCIMLGDAQTVSIFI